MPPFDLPYEPAWEPATLTLLHFLWQGLLVAAVLVLVLWLLRVRRAPARYTLSLLALLAMAACPLVTFALLERPAERVEFSDRMPPAGAVGDVPETESAPVDAEQPTGAASPKPEATAAQQPARSGNPQAWSQAVVDFVRAHQSHVLVGWSVGVCLLSVRLLLSVIGLYWVRGGRCPIPAELAACAARLSERLQLRFAPIVLASERIREALVVGFVRPVVLLPAAWLTEMTPEVLEAVIAHELAHIRRWDLWVNVFQRVVETLLFYHPAVWWLSRRVRLEREMCCDELAVAATGRRGVYVDALELMARKRFVPAKPALAPAIGGNKMVVLNRIRYIAGFSPSRDRARWWPVGLLTLLVLAAVWLASTSAGQPKERAEDEQPAPGVGDKREAAAGDLLRTFRKPEPVAKDGFGYYVAALGNKVFVSAPHETAGGKMQGAVYVFDGLTGKLLRTLRRPNPAATTHSVFGIHFAVSDNRILVGDSEDRLGDDKFRGAAHLFDVDTGRLLKSFGAPSSLQVIGLFGRALTFAGDNVVVAGGGDAYLFDGTTGKLLRTFENPTPAAGDGFGFYVEALGNNVLVGDPNDDEGAEDAGAVYMFDGSTGRLLRTFRSPTPTAKEAFGNHIATLDNKVIIGAAVWESKTRGGAVYLFDASTGKLLQTFKSPAEAPGNRFGRSLATLGNKVIVGAGADDTRAENAGAVYVFDASTGEHLQSVYKPNPVAGDRFGISVAVLGNDILVSALEGKGGGGAAYLFKGLGGPAASKKE